MSSIETSNSSIRPKNNSDFRLYAKSFFLTYPRCEKTKEELQNLLHSKGTPLFSIIAQETHEDGGLHLHAIIQYTKKINIRNPNFFDMEDHHPNIQSPRNIQATRNYVLKADKKPLLYNELPSRESEVILNLYDMARSTGEEEYFTQCRLSKVTIHSKIDKSFVCKSGVEKMHTRYTRYEHLLREYCNRRDNYPRDFIATIGSNRTNEISLDQRPFGSGENNICFETWLETITIRTPSGHTAILQTWIPPDDCIRRHEFSALAKNGSNPTSRHGSSLPNTYQIQGCELTSRSSQSLFE